MRVLVIDDSKFTRSILTNLFRELGVVSPEEATDGNEAIRMLEENHYSIVTVDLVMPSSSGFDVIKYIKQNSQETKIIVCSSTSDKETILQLVKLGINEFILKPFNEEKAKCILKKYVV